MLGSMAKRTGCLKITKQRNKLLFQLLVVFKQSELGLAKSCMANPEILIIIRV